LTAATIGAVGSAVAAAVGIKNPPGEDWRVRGTVDP